MNIELLNKISDLILAEPRRFNMRQYFMDAFDVALDYGEAFAPPCGTAACVAGHALLLNHSAPDYSTKDHSVAATCAHNDAARLLDIDLYQAERLFFEHNWPIQFDPYQIMPHTREYALNAVARIQHFIETGGRE